MKCAAICMTESLKVVTDKGQLTCTHTDTIHIHTQWCIMRGVVTAISGMTAWPRNYWGSAITQTTRTSLYSLQHLHLQISTQDLCPALFLDKLHVRHFCILYCIYELCLWSCLPQIQFFFFQEPRSYLRFTPNLSWWNIFWQLLCVFVVNLCIPEKHKGVILSNWGWSLNSILNK